MKEFYSNGKLLITGEYAVLDGAKALAVPTKFGQSLEVKRIEENTIHWNSFDENDKLWFQGKFEFKNGKIEFISGEENTGKKLQQIINEAHQLNPEIFSEEKMGIEITTRLNFNRNWGLGTSSTLINNIADWFEIDAYKLLKNTFGGSGYDIAASQNTQPITYQITENGVSVLKANFYPDFSENIFFVYLNEKKNSREAIAHYKALPEANKTGLTEKISSLTEQFINCSSLTEFELLINIHETLLSKSLQTPRVKQARFTDFKGAVKSLGGWGGDFVMVTGEKEEVFEYFGNKGYLTIFAFEDIVL
ncbi:GYDIA family GHMP kinase [Salegentibacter salegens]|uniref:Mevalonate kinase n=1 Tax=Salegentibacter salegens TaxID=143223 RepID=A0A1M7N791_9FLAO|nr:GYDIA family GHMP kinase [Salegentibacter salegens]PRX45662.1 mevalonate kinase [Salegentibacter salegens]SHM99318.1 Mevalonate kinase [Salegentibacter salegens]